MNTITDEQFTEIYSIMTHRFVNNNEEMLRRVIIEQVNKHDLVGLARQKFEVTYLNELIKRNAALN